MSAGAGALAAIGAIRPVLVWASDGSMFSNTLYMEMPQTEGAHALFF